MVTKLKSHIENTPSLEKNIIKELTSMYAKESGNLLDAISDIQNTEVREVALVALREYHKALITNNTTFPKVAQILSSQKTDITNAANDEYYGPERLAA